MYFSRYCGAITHRYHLETLISLVFEKVKARKLIDLIDVMCSNIQLFMTAIKYIPQVNFFFPKCNFWNKEDNEG